MRGGPKIPRRAGAQPIPSNEATARAFSIPAPYGGWNARGNLANMPPTDAIVMDNIFPGVQEVQLRKGSIDWVTGFSANIGSLLPYNGKQISKLFAATPTQIFDVTGQGTVGAPVTTCTNSRWTSVNFTTPGGAFLVASNGVDDVKNYDGTTWTTPAITGVTSSTLTGVIAHQKRLWFIEKFTMNAWYLGIEAISGVATKFPFGSLFKKGGYIVALGSWTIDSGSGLNDYFVVVTSNGELAGYQGTDPSNSATWSLVGVFEAPPPLGNQPLLDYGGDLLYLSRNGIIPLSKLVQSVLIDRSQQISFKIDGALLEAASTYPNNAGWQMITFRSANFLIVNVPISQDTLSYQFVMNTITQAWCRFTNWNASCWAVLGENLFFAGGMKVYKAWQGLSDSGAPIIGTVASSYTPLGSRGQKQVTLARPNFGFFGAAQISLALDSDFKAFDGQTLFNYAPQSNAAVWDSSTWNLGIWDGGAVTFEPRWLTVPGDLGYLHSFRLQIITSQSTFQWTSTDYAYKPAGIL